MPPRELPSAARVAPSRRHLASDDDSDAGEGGLYGQFILIEEEEYSATEARNHK